MPKVMGVYWIRNLANGKVYVGSSTDTWKRWRYHRSDLRGRRHVNKHLQHAWNKYGEDNFLFEVIEDVMEDDLLIAREQHWMDLTQCYLNKNGYNFCRYAKSRLGHRHTEEAKRKMSEANRGRQITDETRRRMSEAHKGQRRGPLDEETRRKIGDAHRGRCETKHIGVDHHKAKLDEEAVREIRRSYSNGESISTIARRYGMDRKTIRCVIFRQSWKHVD